MLILFLEFTIAILFTLSHFSIITKGVHVGQDRSDNEHLIFVLFSHAQFLMEKVNWGHNKLDKRFSLFIKVKYLNLTRH